MKSYLPHRVTIIGKDIVRLDTAIKRWGYFNATEIKLLVLAQGISSDLFTRDISVPYMWGVNLRDIVLFPGDIQMCVCFFPTENHVLCKLRPPWVTALVGQSSPGARHQVWYTEHFQQPVIAHRPQWWQNAGAHLVIETDEVFKLSARWLMSCDECGVVGHGMSAGDIPHVAARDVNRMPTYATLHLYGS